MTPRQQNNVAKRFGVGQIDPGVPIGKWAPDDFATMRRKLAPYLDQMLRQKKE
jgi:hypothetical protein